MDKQSSKGKSFLIPLLVILLLAGSFVTGSLWQKVKTLEGQKGANTKADAGGQGQIAGEQVNKLSIDNLKKYAADLKLDTKKFNDCLDKDQKKELVSSEAKEGEAVGVSGTPAFFINGYLLSGALPFEMFKTAIDFELKSGLGSTNLYTDEVKKLVDQGILITQKKDVKTGNSPTKGPSSAKITIVEFSDFECPFCGRAEPTTKQILSTYPNDVKLVFKNYPLGFHANAQKAAEAAACAADQGKFWEYHDLLFAGAN